MSKNDLKKALTSFEGNVLMDIDVSPNSKEFKIAGFNIWRSRVEIRIKELPQKGKANKEIANELSNIFNCNASIFKGEKSSKKTVIFEDTSLDFIFNKLIKVIYLKK